MWRHGGWGLWNCGICWAILGGRRPRRLLAKDWHFGASCLWDVGPDVLRWLHADPSKSYLVPNLMNRARFRGICMESSRRGWAGVSETIWPELLTFGEWASWTLFFRSILADPVVSQISFLWRHHFGTLLSFFFFFFVIKVVVVNFVMFVCFDLYVVCTIPVKRK